MKESKESKEFYCLKALDYKDNEIDFNQFKNKVILITNMATNCGYAKKNLALLADIQTLYGDYGLKVLIFPTLQYTKDETDVLRKMYDVITEYSDQFTVFSDVIIFGKNMHPVFKHIIKWSKGFCGKFMKWNFPKFIINEHGNIVKKFEPADRIEVDDPIFKKLLKNKKCIKKQSVVIKYKENPYELEDSDEKAYY